MEDTKTSTIKNGDDINTVCEVRRRIEDRLEEKRYEEELGDHQRFEFVL